MNRGYTKRWRKRWDRGYHQDAILWVIMDYFIDFATWKDKEFLFTAPRRSPHMVKLKRGDCFFTYSGLAEFLSGSKPNEIQVSRKMVKVRTSFLEKMGFLGHTQGRDYQVVSILNYDKYNPIEDTQGHTQGHGRDMVGPPKGHGRDITNKDKKVKKVKNTTAKPKKAVLPVWLDIEVWKEFKKYRQNGKGKFTPYAQQLAISKLEKLKAAGNNPSEVIKQSILHGWSGLFEIKKEIREEAQQKQKINNKLAEYLKREAL